MTTREIKEAIAERIERDGLGLTVGEVYHCYMVTSCGHDIDLDDAIDSAREIKNETELTADEMSGVSR